ncbi:hypothetical protein SAMN05444580_11153 [Rhodococcus tukisamuensis]|uniref:N-acetyltransferase domain-containing protein n=1 Tax=Rhodococcus tukisamuensis TaxID=168276 RepID=A0A1G7AQS9_9NOCA|nr:hypothetical protein SAMN05444580_11153 [Rhodococcus tukisamuensis]
MTRALSSVICGAEEKIEKTSVWDPRSEYRFVAARPDEEPELWSEYLAGALESYTKHGVLEALQYEQLRDGRSTTLFFVAVGPDGSVSGGMRAQGPHARVEQVHAISEWAGRPGESELRAMVADRLPFGVVEMKTAWVADGAAHRKELTRSLADVIVWGLELLDVQFVLGTAADHVLKLWSSSGGEVSSRIPSTPYPDERYRTRVMWWDRRKLPVGPDAHRLARPGTAAHAGRDDLVELGRSV